MSFPCAIELVQRMDPVFPPDPQPAIAVSGAGKLLLRHRCAWCQSWLDERGSKIQEPLPSQTGPVSHGICPDCLLENFAAHGVPGDPATRLAGGPS